VGAHENGDLQCVDFKERSSKPNRILREAKTVSKGDAGETIAYGSHHQMLLLTTLPHKYAIPTPNARPVQLPDPQCAPDAPPAHLAQVDGHVQVVVEECGVLLRVQQLQQRAANGGGRLVGLVE